MKIKSVKSVGKEKTLDLEVNHPLHQYYCNGFLTSNSHSVSYTFISFYEYWLKAYYDPEFNVALLNNTPLQKEKKGESVIATYLTEMMKKGFEIESPNVNSSERSFTLENDQKIIWGLNWVKNLTDKSIFEIISDRELNGEFKSLDEFYQRIGATTLNKRVLEALVWSGALDCFIGEELNNRYDIYNYIFTTLKKTKKFDPIKGKEDDLIEKEIEYLTISFIEISNFAKIRREWQEQTGSEIDYLYMVEDEGQFSVIGLVDKVENKKTKTGKDYKRITLRDETKRLRMVYLWPWKCKGWDSVKRGMLIQGSLSNDGTFVHLLGWTLITESEKEKKLEEEEKIKEEERIREEKNKEDEKYKAFLNKLKEVKKRWEKQFDVERKIDEGLKQPVLTISSKYGKNDILVYYFNSEKGITRQDLIKMKSYDSVYIIDDESAHLFDMSTFQAKMGKIKSQNRVKFPNIPGDIGNHLPEQIIENKLA